MILTANQARWLAALRSGEYKQGVDYLHDGEGRMCCLGVAAVLFKPDDVVPVQGTDGGWSYDHARCYAPGYVVQALGLYGDCGERRDDDDGVMSLATLNDHGKSFAEIADIFEANVDAYTS